MRPLDFDLRLRDYSRATDPVEFLVVARFSFNTFIELCIYKSADDSPRPANDDNDGLVSLLLLALPPNSAERTMPRSETN